MDFLYNKLRFKNRELFRNHNEKMIRFVFEQLWFFLNTFEISQFSNHDLADFIDFSAENEGIAIQYKTILIEEIMTFLCEQLEISKSFNNRSDIIQEIVVDVLSEHLPGGYKYVELLTQAIVDEFNNSSQTTTMEEIAFRIKNYPELRFLSFSLIEDVVDTVYDCFTDYEPDN